MFKRNNNKAFKKPLIYGIYGLSRGVGTTHLSLSSAYYFHSHLGYKTALLESGSRKSLLSLYNSENKAIYNQSQKGFLYDGIDLYCNVYPPDICCQSYDRVIIDLQDPPDGSVSEGLDFLYILCDNKLWNEPSLKDLSFYKRTSLSQTVTKTFCVRKGSGHFENLKKNGIVFSKIGEIEDPRRLTKEEKKMLSAYFL